MQISLTSSTPMNPEPSVSQALKSSFSCLSVSLSTSSCLVAIGYRGSHQIEVLEQRIQDRVSSCHRIYTNDVSSVSISHCNVSNIHYDSSSSSISWHLC